MPCLSSQDPLPNLTPSSQREWEEADEGPITQVLFGKLNAESRPSVTISTKLAGCYEELEKSAALHNSTSDPSHSASARLRLYKLNMPADGLLEATIDYQIKHSFNGLTCGIYLAYLDVPSQTLVHVHHRLSRSTLSVKAVTHIPIEHHSGLLVELGVFLDGIFDPSTPVELLEITRIVIKPGHMLPPTYQIQNVHATERKRHSAVQKRIVWSWEEEPLQHRGPWPEVLPWSRTTGPFSSFAIYFGGKTIGQAYCSEFPVDSKDIEELEDEVMIELVGNLFGGGCVTSPAVFVSKADLMNGCEDSA